MGVSSIGKTGLQIIVVSALMAALSGCGIGTADTSTSPMVMPALSGKAFGGPTPIVGATVKLYATKSTGYGNAVLLQEANQQGISPGQDTGNFGQFQFAGGYDCPAGQFAYIVASGGNAGGSTVNNNSLLVAALGRCEDLYANAGGGTYTGYTGGTIFVNELTTIAAAYSLGHFATVANSGTGASQNVLIGSSATNNAAQISGVSTGCVANGTTCTTTAAAGLAHAFQNAANLVNVFTNTGTGTGANATLPGNSAAIAPQQLLNTIGNILIACVNSNGGAAGDSSACGQIFSATTIGTNVPADTFSAMVNLAANPTLGGSGTAVANFYAIAVPASSTYSPALASATGLNDYSLAIDYPASAFTAISFPMSGALDINDDYYVGNATYNAGNPGTPVNILSFSSNGATYGSSNTNTTLKAAYGLSVDALGHGYIGNGSASGSNSLGLFNFSNGVTSSTVLTTGEVGTAAHTGNLKVYATAVDQANDLWCLGMVNSSGLSNLYMNPGPYTTATTRDFVAEPNVTVAIPASNFIGLAIDPGQNIWTSASTNLSVVENNGTQSAPTYTGALSPSTTSGSPAVGITFTGTATAYKAWVSSYNTTAGIQSFTPTFDTNTIGVSNVTPGAFVQPASITGSLFNEADGNGTIWIVDTNSVSIQQFNPTSSTAYKLLPCVGGSATCTSVFASPDKPLTLSVDSAGSIWVASAASGSLTATQGTIVEIIGSAAPTWPLLSLGKLGTP